MDYDEKRYFEIAEDKPAYSEFFASIDIALWVGAESIDNVNFTAKNRKTGADVTSDVLDDVKCTFTGNQFIKPFLKAGVEKDKYRATMQVATTEESKEEFYLDWQVKSG